MTLSTLLALLVIVVALPLNWLVTILMWRLSRRAPAVRVLRERAIVGLTLAVIVTVFAAVFVNNELPMPPLDSEATRLLTRSALLVWSVIPPVYWLLLYRRS